eukprot:CAMPEP_0115313996 /NCGR_PEP_ID=MMETSP0270-20121206/76785_1 /TAXON_ID=71861 /ORGANISM="Scrippsiella trochoidea, Strain CCMP3099" /LENGTH=147 /DNA_ID=CAMNT_0002733169 /DNA_START=87 /DNA_END=526 /DNA_ORIENTATION=+
MNGPGNGQVLMVAGTWAGGETPSSMGSGGTIGRLVWSIRASISTSSSMDSALCHGQMDRSSVAIGCRAASTVMASGTSRTEVSARQSGGVEFLMERKAMRACRGSVMIDASLALLFGSALSALDVWLNHMPTRASQVGCPFRHPEWL